MVVKGMQLMYEDESALEDWKVACVIQVYKGRGDWSEFANCRGISRLSIRGKFCCGVLIKRGAESTKDNAEE